MSGPKVVRIVTREELVEICQQHLVRLHVAVDAWIKTGLRNGVVNDTEIAQVTQRQSELNAMVGKEAFEQLQKEVPLEIAQLAADMQERLQKAVDRVVNEKAQLRRRTTAAQELIKTLQSRGIAAPSDVMDGLKLLADGKAASDAGTAIFASAFDLLSPPVAATGATERQLQIAGQLSAGQTSTSFAELKAAGPDRVDDPRVSKLERALSKLQQGDAATATSLAAKLETAIGEPDLSRQTILFDSLGAEIATTYVRTERRAIDNGILSAKLAEVGRYTSPDAIAIAAQLRAALQSAVSPDIGNLLTAADAVLKAELQRVAADARRQAMLAGLAKLGYQVREGMTTDLARGQPVVLPKSATPGFGLEMSANPNNDRMQLRVVAFGATGAPRDKSRDRDIENAWCGDLDRLQALLGSAGGTFNVERAAAAGAVALKVVSAPARDAITQTGLDSVTAPKPQSLPPRGYFAAASCSYARR